MIDKTTAGMRAVPDEVEAVLHSLCGYHLAERDPLHRYTVLTHEQVLYDALVCAIRRERGLALAELVESGHTAAQVAQLANLGTRQRVQRLIAIAKEAETTAAPRSAVVRDTAASFDTVGKLAGTGAPEEPEAVAIVGALATGSGMIPAVRHPATEPPMADDSPWWRRTQGSAVT